MNKLRVILIAAFAAYCIPGYTQTNDSVFRAYIDMLSDSVLNIASQPGMMISITCGDKVVYEKAKGYADINTKELMDLKMRFRIGSLTKTFVVSVLLQLVDEGKIKLDDTLKRFYPNITNADRITIRMLGDMTSGLFNYSETKEFDDSLRLVPLKKWRPEELVEVAVRNAPYFEPGTGFHYSNTNTVLIGTIIEKLTGNTLEDEIESRIFDKLNLKETEFATEPEISGYHSHGYGEDPGTFIVPLEDVTAKYDPSWAWAAGAIVSTIEDIKVYVKALAEGKLTSPEMHAERMKWSVDKGQMKYGLGLFTLGDGYLGHNGSYPGFSNLSVHSPKNNCTAIMFFNTQSNRSPDHLLIRILELMK